MWTGLWRIELGRQDLAWIERAPGSEPAAETGRLTTMMVIGSDPFGRGLLAGGEVRAAEHRLAGPSMLSMTAEGGTPERGLVGARQRRSGMGIVVQLEIVG